MSKCWYCNEELTTGNNPEHLGICDKCYNEMFECGNEFIKNMITKIADLEAKLAEKEEIIKMLKDDNANIRSQCQRFSDDYREIALKQQHKDQDKISFALEQLEKVKASIEERIVIIQENYTDDLYTEKEYLDMTVENENILKKIDNQINVLRNNKDGIH